MFSVLIAYGILSVTLHQARDIISSHTGASKALNMFAEVTLVHQDGSAYGEEGTGEEVESQAIPSYRTSIKKKTNCPTWEATFQFFVTDKFKQNLQIKLKEDRGLIQNPLLDSISIPISELLKSQVRPVMCAHVHAYHVLLGRGR